MEQSASDDWERGFYQGRVEHSHDPLLVLSLIQAQRCAEDAPAPWNQFFRAIAQDLQHVVRLAATPAPAVEREAVEIHPRVQAAIERSRSISSDTPDNEFVQVDPTNSDAERKIVELHNSAISSPAEAREPEPRGAVDDARAALREMVDYFGPATEGRAAAVVNAWADRIRPALLAAHQAQGAAADACWRVKPSETQAGFVIVTAPDRSAFHFCHEPLYAAARTATPRPDGETL
jgi:hypothetical protein